MSSDPYYQKHVFICTQQKDKDKKCCQDADAVNTAKYMKSQLKRLDLWGKGKIRISQSGCLGRCSIGPCIVIYPEGTWYTYQNRADVDQIIQEHLIKNLPVPGLFLKEKV